MSTISELPSLQMSIKSSYGLNINTKSKANNQTLKMTARSVSSNVEAQYDIVKRPWYGKAPEKDEF
jgi:hypothetical protein